MGGREVETTVRQSIREALEQAEVPLRPKEIAAHLGDLSSYASVRQTLRRMLAAGQVVQTSYGHYDVPEAGLLDEQPPPADPRVGASAPNGGREINRHIAYELRDERGELIYRVEIVTSVGRARRATLTPRQDSEHRAGRMT